MTERPHVTSEWNLRPSTCYSKNKIWRPCWPIFKQSKRKARKSVDLDGM